LALENTKNHRFSSILSHTDNTMVIFRDKMSESPPGKIERYELFDLIGTGGMATVHIGRLRGASGFSRTVAIKRLHPQFARDGEFAEMFLDEARVASRIRHPNVVATLDVLKTDSDIILVMEYIDGLPLSSLAKDVMSKGEPFPIAMASAIISGALSGLHAAHIAESDEGTPLNLVHRDVSPENIMLGTDGVSRVLDFGIAKAQGRSHETKEGVVKGKLAYMAPEQLHGEAVSARSDLFSTSALLWELVTGKRLFKRDTDVETLKRVLFETIESPTVHRPDLPAALEAVIMKGLARKPDERHASALVMQQELEEAAPPATNRALAAWLGTVSKARLSARTRLVGAAERTPSPSAAGLRVDGQPGNSESLMGVSLAGQKQPASVDVDLGSEVEFTEMRAAIQARAKSRKRMIFASCTGLVLVLGIVLALRPAATELKTQASTAKATPPSAPPRESVPAPVTAAVTSAVPQATAAIASAAASPPATPATPKAAENPRPKAAHPPKPAGTRPLYVRD
jgi:eukaryotic-like serine/threonine-protein kinase